MLVEFKKDNNKIIKTYTLSDKEVSILQSIKQNNRIDFREQKFNVQNPYDETGTFLLNECWDLINQGFIEEDKDWHYSYILTPLGQYMMNESS